MGKPGEIEKDWSPFRAWGHKSHVPDIAAFILLAAIFLYLLIKGKGLPQYSWQWKLLLEFIVRHGKDGQLEPGLLLAGLATTIKLGIWTLLLSLLSGLALGALAFGKSTIPRFIYLSVITLARNTPPLVILFSVYFMAGNLLPIGWVEHLLRSGPGWLRDGFGILFALPGQLDRMMAAVLALSLYQGAYVAEIVRGAMQSVPQGQWDAARALGLNRRQTLHLVILPQAARMMIPPLTGQTITTFKDTALASLVSVPDLTFQSLEIMAVSGMTFEIWFTTAAIYLIIGAGCALAGFWLERKFTFS